MKILLVDDDPQALDSTRRILEHAGHVVDPAQDGEKALERLRSGSLPDVVVTDLRMPRITGIELLRALRLMGESVPVVLMTAYGSVDDAVEAMKLGAVDFLSKPFRKQTLMEAVEVAARRRRPALASSAMVPTRAEEILFGVSDVMRALRDQVALVARTHATVLITGESGSGKERVAQALWKEGARASGPWVAVNCAALPENLLESELFGHEKGAFTGATGVKRGLFEEADGGTLFLDEIGDMGLSLQAKLLRVLQEGEIRRVGAVQSRKVDVRILAATHQPLDQRVAQGLFRQDLLFRLQVVTLEVPALRDRPGDIAALAEQFLKRHAQLHGKAVTAISEDAMKSLLAHPWPGNVRELANAIERAVIFASQEEILPRDLPEHIAAADDSAHSARGTIEIRLGTPLKEVEDLLIRRTLEATDGDKQMAARLLGINERTIYRRLES